MRKLILLGGFGAAVAIGVTVWRGQVPVSTTPSPAVARIEAPIAAPAAVAPRETALRATADAPAAAEIVTEPLAADADDGDDHGHEQGEIRPLEEPPPSRDAFGADPESETAALAEARATLEALLNDPDPAVKEQASALLETIAAP